MIKKNSSKERSFNVPGFAWAAAFVLLLVFLPQSTLAGGKFSLNGSFHVGSTYPLSTMNVSFDSNIHFRVDLNLKFEIITDKLEIAAMGFYGFNQFTRDYSIGAANMYWSNFSLNAKLIWLDPSHFNLYFQGGFGSYRSKGGDPIEPGNNFGGGFQVPLKGSARLEFGVDYHIIHEKLLTKTKFLTLQLGVIFQLL